MTPALFAWLTWIAACWSVAVFLGLLSGPAPWRRYLAAALGGAALVAPFLIPDRPVLRAGVALQLLWIWVKVLDLGRDPRPRPPAFRVLQLIVLHDLRRDGFIATGLRPTLRWRLAGGALGWGALGALALWLALFGSDALPPPGQWCARHAGGVVFAYAGVEGVLAAFELVYRACGLRPPILHQHPILSRSVTEFWAQRWNRIVSGWLSATFYRPLARQGRPAAGTLAAFVASGALHFYIAWAGVGLREALVMGAFFLVQFPLLVLERIWRQGSWPVPLQRAWTVAWFALTSPLFVGPLLTLLAGGFAPG